MGSRRHAKDKRNPGEEENIYGEVSEGRPLCSWVSGVAYHKSMLGHSAVPAYLENMLGHSPVSSPCCIRTFGEAVKR